jgi:hypothetical protein
METMTHRDIEIQRHKTWRHGDMETKKHEHMDTWAHGYMDTWTWRHGDGDKNMET